MLGATRTFWPLVCVLLFTVLADTAHAQLDADPATMPQPDFSAPEPGRAVVISVTFNTATDVVLDSVEVANTPAPGSEGNAALILLELLDSGDQVIGTRFEWHPLWTREWDDMGAETGFVDESGDGTFYVPLDQDLAAVRIIDADLGMELITVDVSGPIQAYCANNPASELCALLKEGFESP